MENKSPLKTEARIGGCLYLLVIGTAFFAEFYSRGSLIISDDAAATARNILANERLYRLGGIADIVNLLCDIGVAVVLYRLLWPAGRALALYAAVTRVSADLCLAVATFFHFAPLLLLHSTAYLAPLTAGQREALAYECLRMHDVGYNISLLFFGVHLLGLAVLIVRSGLLPRLVGALLLVTGMCYLINSFLHLVVPEFDTSIWLLVPGLISELVLAVWLLARGIDEQKWRAAVASQ